MREDYKTNDPLQEHYTLLLKSARRCMHDLHHCANSLGMHNEPESKIFIQRAEMWHGIFSPSGVKNYRHELHHRIDDLRLEVARLEELCDKNGIDHVPANRIPF